MNDDEKTGFMKRTGARGTEDRRGGYAPHLEGGRHAFSSEWKRQGNARRKHTKDTFIYTYTTIIGSARIQGSHLPPGFRRQPIMFLVISTTLNMVSSCRHSCRHPFQCHENMKASHRRRRRGSPFLPPTSSQHLLWARRMPSDFWPTRPRPKRPMHLYIHSGGATHLSTSLMLPSPQLSIRM